MRILLGSHGFPPNQAAGAEWRTYRTARWLMEHGHTVQVIAVDQVGRSPLDQVEVIDELVDGIPVRRLSYSLDQTAGTLAEFDNPIAYRTIQELFSRESYDIFHLICGYRITGSVLRAAAEAGVPRVLTLTDFWFLCPRLTLRRSTGELCQVPADTLECAACLIGEQRRYLWPHQWSGGQISRMLRAWWRATDFAGFSDARQINIAMIQRRVFIREMLGLVDRVIAPSQFMADFFMRHGLPREQLSVMRQGVNVTGLPNASQSSEHHPLTFGYIGQLAEHKGVDLLVRAFRSLPYTSDQVRLVIYGDPAKAWPPFWKQLQVQLANDPRIILAGSFTNSEAPAVYNQLDALVMPSLWYENSPNVILEAFACKVPVIASNLGGMAELVSHNVNGLLFETGNASALAAALASVVENPKCLEKFRASIQPPITVETEMNSLTALYCEVLVKKPAALDLQSS